MPSAVAAAGGAGRRAAGPSVPRASPTSTAAGAASPRTSRTARAGASAGPRCTSPARRWLTRPGSSVVTRLRRSRSTRPPSGRRGRRSAGRRTRPPTSPPPTACTPRCGSSSGSDRPTAPPPPVRAAPALRGGALDRPRRGALGRGRRDVRDAGRRRRSSGSRSSPRTAGARIDDLAREFPEVAQRLRGASRRHGVLRRRSAAPARDARSSPGGCCSSATPPATSTRSPGRGSRSAWPRPRRWSTRSSPARPEDVRATPGGDLTRTSRVLTETLLRATRVPVLRRALVPSARALPWVFRSTVAQLA